MCTLIITFIDMYRINIFIVSRSILKKDNNTIIVNDTITKINYIARLIYIDIITTIAYKIFVLRSKSKY